MVEFLLSPKQIEALSLLSNPEVVELLFGGGKGSGKSILECVWMLTEALDMIQTYDLSPSRYPLAVGFMGRKIGADFNDTTLETWKRHIPGQYYRIHKQDKEIVINGTVKILYGGMDSQEDVDKFKSAEFARFAIDEAQEVTRDDIADLRGAMRLQINGVKVPPKGLYGANPAECWLIDEFVDAADPARPYLQALPSDNPWLGQEYIEALRAAYRHRPELLKAYIEGEWHGLGEANVVIKGDWIRAAATRVIAHPVKRRLIACDPARFGDDETVIYGLENTEVKIAEIYGQKDTMYTANKIFVLARQFGTSTAVVDAIGVGAGVADRLVEMGMNVIAVNSATKPDDRVLFYNRRAEMWWQVAEMFSGGDVVLTHDDPTLTRQLGALKYEYKAGKLLVEAKETVKRRLGHSPDRADAYVMGLSALRLVEPMKETGPFARTRREEVRTAMAM
jgi:hypothetical protein